MGIFTRDPNRHHHHGVPAVLSLLFLLLSVQCGSGQPGTGTPPTSKGTKVNDPVALLILVMFFVLFIMVLASIFCRRYADPYPQLPLTITATEPGGVITARRAAARGLDAQVIESFPTFLYSEVRGLRIGKGGVECAVCLNEFEDDETLRLMPPCSHVFHTHCVDVWLSSRATCPVCRANLVPKPGESFTDLIPEPDPIPVPRVTESAEVQLIDPMTWTNRNRPPRSRSTGFSTWSITGILFPRSHSTGHLPVQPGENVDRFTLRLPEEVHRQLIQRNSTLNRTVSSNVGFPQARSSRRGYRSGSVGGGNALPRNRNRRAFSLSLSFSLRSGSVRWSSGSGNAVAPPIIPPASKESGERSFERLRPDDQV